MGASYAMGSPISERMLVPGEVSWDRISGLQSWLL
jgi:hypothetical protein